MNTATYPRGQWMRLLMAAPRAALLATGAELKSTLQTRYLALPQNGLALLPLRDGAFADAFNLGEIPLAKVHLAVTAQDGREARGAAWVMDDDMALVETLAIADALIAAEWPEAAPLLDLMQQGATAVARIDFERKAMLAATTVDFSLLGATDDEDDDDA